MTRYKMRQRLISIGEDFTIEDEHGNPVYTVDGKVLRIRETFVIEDQQGNEVATIREKKLALRDSMTILRGRETIATIRTWSLRATFWITSMLFAGDARQLHRCRNIGSRCATPTASRLLLARMTASFWPSRLRSMRWRTIRTKGKGEW